LAAGAAASWAAGAAAGWAAGAAAGWAAGAAAGWAAGGTAASAGPALPGISGEGAAAPLMATRPADNSAGLLFMRRPSFVLSCYLLFVL
jgi:hypothetical protein